MRNCGFTPPVAEFPLDEPYKATFYQGRTCYVRVRL